MSATANRTRKLTTLETIQRQVNLMVTNGVIGIGMDHTSKDVATRIYNSLGKPKRIFTLDGDAILVWEVT